MRKALLLLLLCLPALALSKDGGPLPGSTWFDRDLTMIFSIALDGRAYYMAGLRERLHDIPYTRNDDGLQFQSEAQFPFTGAKLSADRNSLILNGPDTSLTLPRAPNVETKDLIGKWYSYDNNEIDETSAIITFREHDYDYDYVTLNHTKRQYSTTTEDDRGTTWEIHHGWMMYEGSEPAFIITRYTGDEIEYTDMSGTRLIERRYSGEQNIAIPEGYTPMW